jgi:hypothetical protein
MIAGTCVDKHSNLIRALMFTNAVTCEEFHVHQFQLVKLRPSQYVASPAMAFVGSKSLF